MSLNKVLLIGNLGRDAEMKYTGTGTAIARFSIATTERRKSGGEWTDHTEWHRVTLFGKSAEALQNYLKKGKQVYVEGRIETRSWEQDGEKKYSTEVVAERVQLLGGAKGERRDQGGDDYDYGQGEAY